MIRANRRRDNWLAAVAFSALLVAAQGASAAERLVIATWGGVWGDSLKANVMDPFTAKHKVEFAIFRQASAEGTSKVIAEKDKPTIDILFCTPGAAYNVAKAGAALPLDVKEVPQLANIPKALFGVYEGQALWLNSGAQKVGVTIRKDLIKVPDKVTVAWLTDASLKGKIAWPHAAWNFGLPISHLSYAGAASNPTIDNGFATAAKIAPNIRVVYGTTGEMIRLLTSGEVAVGYGNATTPSTLLKNGLPIEFRSIEDLPTFVTPETLLVVKGGPAGKELALKFLDFFLSPDVLLAYNIGIGASSVNVKSPPASKDVLPFSMTTEEVSQARLSDVTMNMDAVQERWKRDIVPLIAK